MAIHRLSVYFVMGILCLPWFSALAALPSALECGTVHSAYEQNGAGTQWYAHRPDGDTWHTQSAGQAGSRFRALAAHPLSRIGYALDDTSLYHFDALSGETALIGATSARTILNLTI